MQLDYFLFVSGFSFILLAATAFSLRKIQGERLAWGWLALFGLGHGLGEWLEVAALSLADPAAFAAARAAVMALSFISLLEFGRRRSASRAALFPALYIALVPLALAGALYGVNGLNVSVRYALGLTGCLAAALAFRKESEDKQLPERLPLLSAAAALAIYAIAAGAVTPKAPFPPAAWLNQDNFMLLAGFPVQLLRGLLAAAAAAGTWLYFLRVSGKDLPEVKPRRSALGLALLIALFISLPVGLALTNWLGASAAREVAGKSEIMGNVLVNRVLSFTGLADRTAAAIASSPAIKRALTAGKPALEQANRELENLSSAYGLSICYLLDRRGTAVASSNRRTEQSLVGRSYSFRPYFIQAIAGALSQYYAVGETTGERGYYAASPVLGPGGKAEGVAVAKADISSLDEELLLSGRTFVVSPDGIIFMSSRPELLFRSLWPVDRSKQKEIEESRQFGWVDFSPVLPRVPDDGGDIPCEGSCFYAARSQLGGGWSVVDLQPMNQVRLARLSGIMITLTSCLVLILSFTSLILSAEARAGRGLCPSCRKKPPTAHPYPPQGEVMGIQKPY